ncbi:helix-turn-helix domain-containing protein [Nonomuraea cavernae]|uniref:Transcriptional regulator n=1 Tax=Nonomuraea cavernae TaxID=2045107 RepID=A0A917Z5B5_9ACTN|nr:helix-turn-helix transcriptional regulator [Nonomuraea cavernae]MCA2188657.1 helix-turn-helix domain-containing protein [Nonomuraea cavernae]GGO74380.1 transcriptional regulator [Nonomuraea cavernae]
MSAQRSPSARQRRLAAILRSLRKEKGLSRDAVAERLGCSAPTVTRIEAALVGARISDVTMLLEIYEVPPHTREILLQLARDARKRGWWDKMSDTIPEYFQSYVGLEEDASSICGYETEYVPGLFQTEEYARAVMGAEPTLAPDEELTQSLSIRMKRQELLTSATPPEMWMVLNEAVIRREVGGKDVMRRQLLHLLELSQQNPINIQVLAFDSGAHPAMNGGFSILKFPKPSDPDVVYVEYWRGSIYLEAPNDVNAYNRMFDHLRARALGPDATRRLIEQAAGGTS